MKLDRSAPSSIPLDRIEARVDHLYYQDGTHVVRDISPYYEDFIAFLRAPKRRRKRYRDYLLADDTMTEQTQFRAASILAARKFGIGYDEARNLVEFMDISPSPAEAADLVLDNYLGMAESGEIFSVYASIVESGRIVVIEGLHRLSINMANGHTTCPINVLRRHELWASFISFFHNQSSTLYGDPTSLYHAIDHPDFRGWKVLREDRSAPIIAFLSDRYPGAARGVDIGSMIGFYSHALVRAGYDVTSIEKETDYAASLRRLSDLYGLNVPIAEVDIYDYDFESGHFDFAIALSIFYHLYRNDAAKCAALVSRLKKAIPVFFVDTESRTGILPEASLRQLFEGFELTLIHRGADDRDIFAITRPL